MLNVVLWVLGSGSVWRDISERFGLWSTVYQRFRDWRNRGTFDQMVKQLPIKLNEQGLIELEIWMIDSTAVRAPWASSGAGEKRGPEEPQDHTLGRSRGGLRMKIRMLCDANGVPLNFLLPGEQTSNIIYAQPPLDNAYIQSLRGLLRKRCRWLLADKAYDAGTLRRYCDCYRMQSVIPLCTMKRKPKRRLPRFFGIEVIAQLLNDAPKHCSFRLIRQEIHQSSV